MRLDRDVEASEASGASDPGLAARPTAVPEVLFAMAPRTEPVKAEKSLTLATPEHGPDRVAEIDVVIGGAIAVLVGIALIYTVPPEPARRLSH